MSGNANRSPQKKHIELVEKSSPKLDRRVRRTRDALGDALMALMEEKPFDEITVQHVLDRANVGRSTFYAHFRDKDDLFISDSEEFFDLMSQHLSQSHDPSNRVAPVLEMFSHLTDVRQFYAALVAAGKTHVVHEMGRRYFARGIDQRLKHLAPWLKPVQRSAAAQMYAGALLSLMSGWIQRGMVESPKAMDELYHQMVWSGIGSPERRSAGAASR